MKYTPDTEGSDHVNAYSKSKTTLGRLLSNFAHTPVDTDHGRFESIEGYWYWLACANKKDPKVEALRFMYGWEAKQLGRELRGEDWPDTPEFRKNICAAISNKIKNHRGIKGMLELCEVPIVHYYAYGKPGSWKIHHDPRGDWVFDHMESIRKYLRGGR